jgi:hypothetical protein
MDRSTAWDVLKWVLAALAAGFVGQFGRSLALHMINRRRKGKDQQSNKDYASNVRIEMEKTERLKTIEKLNKKRDKSEHKTRKKRSD